MADKNGGEIVLHFDVNKTILISDPAAGKSTNDMINSIIAEIAWGTINKKDGKWSLITNTKDQLKSYPPSLLSWVNYHDYVEQLFPFPEKTETETTEERSKKIKKLKEKRHNLTSHFTDVGNPGEELAPFFEELKAAMVFEIQKKEEEEESRQEQQQHFILPSFFELILHLVQTKRTFSIIFRTFGDDIEKLKENFNHFCEGKHPLYPDVCLDGRNGSVDLRFSVSFPEKQEGCFFRNEEGTYLVFGTTSFPKEHEEGVSFYKNEEKVFEGFGAIHEALRSKVHELRDGEKERGCILALRDYYKWWGNNMESPKCGKPFPLNQKDKETLQIFFDDNVMTIEGYAGNIVDTRDVESGEHLELERVLDRHVVKALPHRAILEKNYFIEVVQKLEASFGE